MTCTGAGKPPRPSYDWKAEPPCGHMFHWRSLKERTGGTGKWPITVTTTWAVAWQSNTDVAGTDTYSARGDVAITDTADAVSRARDRSEDTITEGRSATIDGAASSA